MLSDWCVILFLWHFCKSSIYWMYLICHLYTHIFRKTSQGVQMLRLYHVPHSTAIYKKCWEFFLWESFCGCLSFKFLCLHFDAFLRFTPCFSPSSLCIYMPCHYLFHFVLRHGDNFLFLYNTLSLRIEIPSCGSCAPKTIIDFWRQIDHDSFKVVPKTILASPLNCHHHSIFCVSGLKSVADGSAFYHNDSWNHPPKTCYWQPKV